MKEGAFAILEDITDILRLKEEVASREYLKTLSDLIASVAHEVRNPLNAISIAAQRLGQEFEVLQKDEESRGLLRTIENEVKRVDKLNVNKAMDQARNDCKGESLPIVAHRKDYGKWLITMDAEDWFNLYKEYWGSLREVE